MATFKRGDYVHVFQIACTLYSYRTLPAHERQRLAVKLMDMCEGVLGQLHRPDRLTRGEASQAESQVEVSHE